MSVRVCPICDKKMKYNHFCTNCKAYIKEPLFWERTYNLNGDGESTTIVNQCENHDHRRENATGKIRSDYNTTRSDAGTQRQQRQKTVKSQRTRETGRGYQQSYNQHQTERPVKKKRNILVTIFVIYVLIQVLLPILFGVLSFLSL